MLPALERSPATEAVAMMEPEGWGLVVGWVRRMAGGQCLRARKTLDGWALVAERFMQGERIVDLKTFVLIVFINSSSDMSENIFIPAPTTPALAKKMSSLP